MEFPAHVYRSPGNYESRGKSYKVASVTNEDELQAHIDAGWHLTLADAFQAAGDAAVVRRKVADWRSQKKAAKRRADFKVAKAQARAARAARDAGLQPVAVASAELPDDNAPPTRAELEAQATKLGIRFGPRTSDERLLDRINEAMKES